MENRKSIKGDMFYSPFVFNPYYDPDDIDCSWEAVYRLNGIDVV